MLCMVLSGMCIAAAEVPYESLPKDLRATFEAEMESARLNAQSRAPGQSLLQLEAKGGFSGYTDVVSDGSLKVEYRVTDSVVQVGEKVNFYVTMSCDYPVMSYTYSGQVFYEDFSYRGRLDHVSDETDEGVYSKTLNIPARLDQAGFFNFVIVVKDGIGNTVAITTPTIMVYDGEEPNYDGIGSDTDVTLSDTDNYLGIQLSADRTSVKVGDIITATTTFTTKADPIEYKAVWSLLDADGNVLDTLEETDEVLAETGNAIQFFSYQPLQAGEVQFVITATDGDDNAVKINTPCIPVEDGFYVEASLNKSVLSAGAKAKGTYTIYGHECDEARYFVAWECFDDEGERVFTRSFFVNERSGTDTYAPRYGSEVVFSVGAVCSHVASVTEYDYLTLEGGLTADIAPVLSTVASGSAIGATYSIQGGLTPYQDVTILGYSSDSAKATTYNFLKTTVTQTEGTVSGTPYLGDAVYFVLQVTEADGLVSTWTSEEVPLTGAPAVTSPTITASFSSAEIDLGQSVTLTYQMSGGSGTINGDSDKVSYARLVNAEGTVLAEQTLTAISGTVTFTPPEEAGQYQCVLLMRDGYGQQADWSGSFRVRGARIPGDANDDGVVNIYDALLVLQYDAGWNVSLNTRNADVNASDGVDIYDALLILQYGAGEDVTLK